MKELRKRGMEVFGFFYNPNIHPYQEYKKRLEAVNDFSILSNLKIIYRDEYRLEEFLQNVVFREKERCIYCYHTRLKATAQVARKGKFDFFTTTLLYSKSQKHQLVKEIGDGLAKESGVKFLYEDFRKGWKDGIEISHEMGFYRQQNCGCIQ